MSKLVTSGIVGQAIEEGYIQSIQQPVTDLIPELRGGEFSQITFHHLLTMMSGVIPNFTPHLEEFTQQLIVRQFLLVEIFQPVLAEEVRAKAASEVALDASKCQQRKVLVSIRTTASTAVYKPLKLPSSKIVFGRQASTRSDWSSARKPVKRIALDL